MYTVRSIPPDRRTDARGPTLIDAFQRLISLSGIVAYRFTRTGRQMHLLTAPSLPDAPEFASSHPSDPAAWDEIRLQVLRHGLGQFTVMTDAEYDRLLAGERVAAE